MPHVYPSSAHVLATHFVDPESSPIPASPNPPLLPYIPFPGEPAAASGSAFVKVLPFELPQDAVAIAIAVGARSLESQRPTTRMTMDVPPE
jgi:hypothetical protein